MKTEQKNSGITQYIRSNKKITIATIGMILLLTYILATDIFRIPGDLGKHIHNIWYMNTMAILLLVLFLSLPLTRTYKEKTALDWHLTANKIFWVFLIGMFSLTNVRNSYLANIDYKIKISKILKSYEKDIQVLKQTNNKREITLQKSI